MPPKRAARWLSTLAALALIALTVQVFSPQSARAQSAPAAGVAQAVLAALDAPGGLPLVVRQHQDILNRYYIDQNGPLLWIGTGRVSQLISRLEQSYFDGLDARDYRVKTLKQLAADAARSNAVGRARIELTLSAYFLKFVSDLKTGRFLPRKVDPELYWHKKKVDFAAALSDIAQSRDLSRAVAAWQPRIPDYLKLKTTLAQYYRYAQAGGWPKIDPGDPIKPGMSDPRVRQLRARLAVTDRKVSLTPPGAPERYDDGLVAAVKRFQQRHGLERDGVIGRGTLFALNISVAGRLRQIIVSMERWRWMPERLGRHYIMVNIAGFELRRVRERRVEEIMRVVVGKKYHQSPVFSDKIKYLEFNPYWNVPRSIATKEELPRLKRNPARYDARGFEAVVNGNPVPVASVDWSAYSRSHFPVRLRQRPGPRNALGRVKFMFPNRFNVYLHDTPSRSLFARAARAFSHGCIRLHRPVELAEQVLAATPGWDRNRINAVLASKERTIATLATPLPVHLTYSTAWFGPGGVQFRPDIYRRDAKLHKALFGQPSS